MTQDYLTTREAAEKLRCSRDTVRDAIADGRLQAVRFGNKILVPVTALQEALRPATGRREQRR